MGIDYLRFYILRVLKHNIFLRPEGCDILVEKKKGGIVSTMVLGPKTHYLNWSSVCTGPSLGPSHKVAQDSIPHQNHAGINQTVKTYTLSGVPSPLVGCPTVHGKFCQK